MFFAGVVKLLCMALEFLGVNEERQSINICTRCDRNLREDKSMPRICLANGLLFGPTPEIFKDLTLVAWKCMQRFRCFFFIEHLQNGDRVSDRKRDTQLKLQSHVVAFPQVGTISLVFLMTGCAGRLDRT